MSITKESLKNRCGEMQTYQNYSEIEGNREKSRRIEEERGIVAERQEGSCSLRTWGFQGVPCRLARHRWDRPGGHSEEHIDLFLRLERLEAEGSPLLATYQLSRSFGVAIDRLLSLPTAYNQSQSACLELALFDKRLCSSLDAAKISPIWPAWRKKDHRLLYWDYSGPIESAPGGSLSHIAYGTLFFSEKFNFFTEKVGNIHPWLHILYKHR